MRRITVLGILFFLLAWSPSAAGEEADFLSASVHPDREALVAGEPFRLAVVLDIRDGFHVNANPALAGLTATTLTPQPHDAVRWGEVRYPPGGPFAAEWAPGGSIAVYAGRTILLVEGTVAAEAPAGETLLRLDLEYQGCDAQSCYPPAKVALEAPVMIVPAGAPAAPANVELFAAADRALAAPKRFDLEFEGETDLAARYEESFLAYVAVLLLFGLALNLTPCVFPLIPVTMSVFAQQGESRPAKVLPLALAYVLGLAATFTAVGVLAALAGQSVGLVLREPAGVLAVVAALAVLMASTYGAFDIQLPPALAGRLGARRGLLGALGMGMVMGAVAAPCVGPFMLALITFVAAAGSVLLGAVSFFLVGLGLGAPYIVLGTFTGLVNRFPRSGGWLVWTKRLMGTTLAGLILWFVKPFVAEEFFWPLVLGVFVFAAVFLGVLEGWSRRPFSRRFWAVRIVTMLAILAAGMSLYGYATAERPEVDWRPWDPGALEAAQAEGKPVLLYFGADWCPECIAWHYQVFTAPEVVAASENLDRIHVDVTHLAEGPKKDFAERFEARNPPVVIVFDARGTVVKAYRNPPSASAFAAALREAAGR